MDPLDIVDTTVGYLKIIGLERMDASVLKSGKPVKNYVYKCSCKCGKTVLVRRGNLTQGHTKSCGCLVNRLGNENPGWRGHGGISGYNWARIRNHRKRARGELEFSITKEEAWMKFLEQGGKCALTGWTLSIGLSSKRKTDHNASLDRIDSSKGYVKGNIQWVHRDINNMKWDIPQDRFVEACKAIAAFMIFSGG